MGQGAHEGRRNSSPEFVLATVGSGRGRRRCYGSREGKPEAWLDAGDHGDAVCVNEMKRGGLKLPGYLPELKTDGGAQSLVGVDAQGRPRSNEGHGQMRQEVGKV